MKAAKHPSNRLTLEDAIEVWRLNLDGEFQNRIGGFPAWFLLAVMSAIGLHTLRLE